MLACIAPMPSYFAFCPLRRVQEGVSLAMTVATELIPIRLPVQAADRLRRVAQLNDMRPRQIVRHCRIIWVGNIKLPKVVQVAQAKPSSTALRLSPASVQTLLCHPFYRGRPEPY